MSAPMQAKMRLMSARADQDEPRVLPECAQSAPMRAGVLADCAHASRSAPGVRSCALECAHASWSARGLRRSVRSDYFNLLSSWLELAVSLLLPQASPFCILKKVCCVKGNKEQIFTVNGINPAPVHIPIIPI